MPDELLALEAKIFEKLKTIYDPEIPVNIYDLGLIYEVDIDDYNNVDIDMTLTAPNCPLAEELVQTVRDTISNIEGIYRVNVNLVFEPPWDKTMMSDEAKLELGFM